MRPKAKVRKFRHQMERQERSYCHRGRALIIERDDSEHAQDQD